MSKLVINHESGGVYAYPLSTDTLVLTVRSKRNDLKSCSIVYEELWQPAARTRKAKACKVASDDLFDYFTAKIKVPYKSLRYLFRLDTDRGKFWYSRAGITSDKPERDYFFQIVYIRDNDVVSVPEWAKGAVVYQIIPERFYNGDESNDPPNKQPWGKLPVTKSTFYGGDLQGIIEKIPYLSELGVDAIYLTPIFASPTPHKYDTVDYYKVDPSFGGNKKLKELVDKCHERGIKVILDGVFNHCGFEFWAFQDVLENGPTSKYSNWFKISGFPIIDPQSREKMERVLSNLRGKSSWREIEKEIKMLQRQLRISPPNYECWAWSVWYMPRFKTENPEVRNYLTGVATHWMKEAGVDGWRLDCAGEVDHEFWREFRKKIKMLNPNSLLIAEIWDIASQWLQGDEFDSTMNYPFRKLVIDFFAKNKINAEEFDTGLAKIRMAYKEPVNQVLYNLIGSHDTPRFLTLCRGDLRKMMLAVIFQFTYPGMPAIYYGDERGMVGGPDPDCRRAMDWGELKGEKLKLFELYKKLIALRKEHPALRYGEFRTHRVDKRRNFYSYMRLAEGEEILVALNNSGRKRKVRIDAPKGWRGPVSDLLEGGVYEVRGGKIHASLGPHSGLILKQAKKLTHLGTSIGTYSW